MNDDKEFKEFENLPEGWKWVRLGEVIEEVNEKVGKKNLEPVAVGVNGVKKRSEIYYKDLAEDYSKNKVFKTNNIAFGLGSNEMAIGVNIFKKDYCVSPAYKVFELKEQNALYFHYFFDFFKKVVGVNFLILSARQGKSVDFEKFIKEYIILPPLPEQQKIAEILETVDNAIEKTDKVIERYKRIKQGLMQDLLTKGIDENGNIRDEKTHRFKDSPLGRIPEEWEVVRLGEVGEIIMGQSPASALVNQEGNGIPFLQGSAEFGVKYPLPKNWIVKPLKIAPIGSILVSVRAPVGDINIANNVYSIGRGLSAIKINDSKVNNLFIWYNLYFYRNKLVKMSQGSTFEAVGYKELNNFLIPLPPLPEQQRIAEILTQTDQTIEKEQQYKEKLQRIKQGLMQDLLTGKVRVNNLLNEGEGYVSQA